jgi:bifunctional non-homologous end joining protein LigD
MSLQEYRRKRDFQRTPEPRPKASKRSRQPRFVVQKHAATRLHYDFRLEFDGVLKSWAVPKGPSLDPAVKALAVQVEDHPLSYADFEGLIPKGQYGGGTVMVWDRGGWHSDDDVETALRKGKLEFELFGEKLSGRWSLVRMGGRAGDDGKNWLLLKRKDDAARSTAEFDVKAELDRSVLTGRTLDEITAGKKGRRRARSRAAASTTARDAGRNGRPAAQKSDAVDVAALPGASPAKLPRTFHPQLATLVEHIPTGDDWLHEAKFDGYRIVARCENGHVRLFTRKGNDWTDRFPKIAAALSALSLDDTILDGEVVVLDQRGRSDFQKLQNSLEQGRDASLVYYLFDAPILAGHSLIETPLVERKEVLELLLRRHDRRNRGVVRYSAFIRGAGIDVLHAACKSALEGIVSKRANSPYEQRRTRTWVKSKCLQRQEFVIGGYSPPAGSRTGFGALLLGFFEHGQLHYCGRVGTGFTEASLRELHRKLEALCTARSPFAAPPSESRDRQVTWVKPQLVAEITFTEWTGDGILRHPSFRGLREDKRPAEIGRERPVNATTKPRRRTTPKRHTRAARSTNHAATVAGIAITHPERVVDPESGRTKLEVAQYYEATAEWILPHVIGRPLSLVRCPQGRHKQCFYQKHLTEAMPEQISGVMVEEMNGREEYVMIRDRVGLIALVQMGVLEIHPWGARADNVERPDRLVFDLDPGEGVEWQRVIDAARQVRDVLQQTGLESFVRTSGGKGLHVVVPLQRRADWEQTKQFTASIAEALVQRDPDHFVMTMTKSRRKGKVFVDYFRNGRGATAVASYSTRARAAMPVATPLRWEELAGVQTSTAFTVSNLPQRLARLKRDPWDGFFEARQSLTAKVLGTMR